MDMKPIWGAVAFGTLLTAALPALADVKAGVDAWQQGDYAKAIAEWRPLANAGDPDAQFNLGQAYKLGRGVPADLNSAVDWYRKATAQGHARAEDNLGLLMFQQGDRAGAMPYLQHAAARGETRAQYIVGTALFNGDMVGKDWVRAYAMMTRASASGLPQATTSLQQMDKYIPADQRKQGLALASSMEAQEKSLASASLTLPATAAQPRPAYPAPAPAKPAPAPVTQVAVAKPQPAAPKPAPEASKPPPSKPTPPKPAPSKMPAPAASGDWRVQLGAFGDEGRARALWSQLTRKVSGLSGYQPYLVKAGSVTRLQAGPIASSADASRLCSSIKAAGADCMPKKN
ncbi:SPOR domain-containing protein [Sphingobium sp.]|uniref:SPOR domain-containing protein n=1 Tax=Sphingobium sp. TaxID=1912891 RepID=UPI000DB7AD38|nr:SPOR domain-containing protein [Sphingobium sp.]PZU70448.1 MAG: hypothetical protein DI540_02700 [Sphingobium sp.]